MAATDRDTFIPLGTSIAKLLLIATGQGTLAAAVGEGAGLLARLRGTLEIGGKRAALVEKIADDAAAQLLGEHQGISEADWHVAARLVASLIDRLSEKERLAAGYDWEELRRTLLALGGTDLRRNLDDESAKQAFDWVLEVACQRVADCFTEKEALASILESVEEVRAGIQRLADRPAGASQTRAVVADHLEVVRDLAPDPLEGRERELAELETFVRGSQETWYAMEAGMISGKTALMSSFTLNPPSDVHIVSFFIRRMGGDGNDWRSFSFVAGAQLAEILGDEYTERVSEPASQNTEFRQLLRRAAAACQSDKNPRPLVLVIDGVDEDSYYEDPDAPGTKSILSLLPRHLPEGVKLVTASRPNPRMPEDIVCNASRVVVSLKPSPIAQEKINQKDIETFFKSDLAVDIGAFLAACGGSLTVDELRQLIARRRHVDNVPSRDVKACVDHSPGRMLMRVNVVFGDREIPSYTLGHDAVLRAVLREISPDLFGEGNSVEDEAWWVRGKDMILEPYRAVIRKWVTGRVGGGWDRTIPTYLLSDACFDIMLAGGTELSVQTMIAKGRYDQILIRSGKRSSVLRKVDRDCFRVMGMHSKAISVETMKCLWEVLRLRNCLARRSLYIPGLLKFRVVHLNEAREQVLDELLAIDSVEDRLKAVEEVVGAVRRVGRDCEVEFLLLAVLETLVHYSELRVKIARMLIDVTGVDTTASNLSPSDLKWRVSLYDHLLTSLRRGRSDSGEQSLVDVERCYKVDHQKSTSYSILWDNEKDSYANLSSSTWSILEVMTLLTGMDVPEWAQHVSDAVKRGMEEGSYFQQDEDRLMKLFSLLGALDSELTFKYVEKIDDCWLRSKVLASVVVAMVATEHVEEAQRWVVVAEQSAARVQELFHKADALANVAIALISVGQVRKSEEVASWAHMTALRIPVLWRRLEVLTKLLDALADSHLLMQIQRIVESVLHLVDELEFPEDYPDLLSDLLSVLARTGYYDDVQRVAESTLVGAEGSEVISENIEPLVRVVDALSVIGDEEKAKRVAKFALSVWRKSGEWSKTDESGVLLVVALVQVGHVDEALGVATDISDPAGRARTLVALAEMLAEVGDVGEAKLVSENAVKGLFKPVECPMDHAKELGGVVNAMVVAGDVDRALRVAKMAVSKVAELEEIEFDCEFPEVVRDVTAALVSEVSADAVLEIIDLIQGPMSDLARSWVLVDMAGARARAGDADAAFELQAQIEVKSLRPMALISIVEALVEVGQIDAALNFVNQIDRFVERVEALASVANALASKGLFDRARQVFESAVSLLDAIQCSGGGLCVLSLVARLLVWDELSDLVPGVVNRIEMLGLGNELGDVGRAVLLARANRVDEALGVVERIEEPRDYVEGLIKVACAMVRVNRVDEAIKLVGRIEMSDVVADGMAEVVGVLIRAGAVSESLNFVEVSDHPTFRSRAKSIIIKELVREGFRDKALNVLEAGLAEVEGFARRKEAAKYCAVLAAACLDVVDLVGVSSPMFEWWLGLTRSVLARSWFYGASVWDNFDVLVRVAPDLAVQLVDERILAEPEGGTAPESDPDLGYEGPGGEAGSYR